MLIRGDARALPLVDACVDCVVTSPPYWGLRDYGSPDQIGLEATPAAYVEHLVQVFAAVRRVLKDDGTVFLNLGDCYATGAGAVGDCPGGGEQGARWKTRGPSRPQVPDGKNPNAGIPTFQPNRMPLPGLKPKDLVGIPWRVAFALQADGWYLRSDIIWSKPNPMPESVTDRPTKAHEYLFLLTKSERYYYDASAIAEPVSESMRLEMAQGYDGLGLKDYEAAGVQNPSSVKARIIANAQRKNEQSGDRRKEGFNDRWDSAEERRRDLQQNGKYADMERSDMRFGGAPGAPGALTRNRRTVWTIPTMPYAGAHFATMPEKLVEPCILAGCPLGGLVLDPFCGTFTVGAVAARLGRRAVGVDLSYQDLARERTAQRGLMFSV